MMRECEGDSDTGVWLGSGRVGVMSVCFVSLDSLCL